MMKKESVLVEVPCVFCGVTHTIELDSAAWKKYCRGQSYVQDLFPDLSPGLREMLISRVCEECFDKMWKSEEE